MSRSISTPSRSTLISAPSWSFTCSLNAFRPAALPMAARKGAPKRAQIGSTFPARNSPVSALPSANATSLVPAAGVSPEAVLGGSPRMTTISGNAVNIDFFIVTSSGGFRAPRRSAP